MKITLKPTCKNTYYTNAGAERKTGASEVTVSYKNGDLSFSGEIRAHGHIYQSGQIVDELRHDCEPANGWSREMATRLCDLWERWHLNSLRPYCEHQKALGWDEAAKRAVLKVEYKLRGEVLEKRGRLIDTIENALCALGEVKLTDEQRKLYAAKYFVTVATTETDQAKIKSAAPGGYELYALKGRTIAGHTAESDLPGVGLLGKPCPVCGYRYGTDWKTEPIPKSVIDELNAFPHEGGNLEF